MFLGTAVIILFLHNKSPGLISIVVLDTKHQDKTLTECDNHKNFFFFLVRTEMKHTKIFWFEYVYRYTPTLWPSFILHIIFLRSRCIPNNI